MNIQAIVFTFIFVIGILLLLISAQEGTISAENRLADKTITALRWSGIGIMIVGFIGLVYTFGEIVYRQHLKQKHGHKRKWEKQIIERHEKSRATTVATATRHPSVLPV